MSSSRHSHKKPKIQLLAGVGVAVPHTLVRSFRPVVARAIPERARPTRKVFSGRTLHLWSVAAESARLELEQTGSLPSSIFDFD